MFSPRLLIPDAPLRSFAAAGVSSALRRRVLIACGTACARQVAAGGRLRDLRAEEAGFRDQRLILPPPAPGAVDPYPAPAALEADLEGLEMRWSELIPEYRDRLTFLAAFVRAAGLEAPWGVDWARVWLRQRGERLQAEVRWRYERELSSLPSPAGDWAGNWLPDPTRPLAVLGEELEAGWRLGSASLHHSRRAEVRELRLGGEQVVVKRYAVNPRAWRRGLELPRARRAWAAARLLRELELEGLEPLGWLERRRGAHCAESYFISRPRPQAETLRRWLRRELPRMSAAERVNFRHRLREELLRLYAHGLVHVDLKLANLLVESAGGGLRFIWIDLEDLRPRRRRFPTFVRNLYQINGSLPRAVSEAERTAFCAGFRSRFPLADHPWVLAYVRLKTRIRLQRELRRVCGA